MKKNCYIRLLEISPFFRKFLKISNFLTGLAWGLILIFLSKVCIAGGKGPSREFQPIVTFRRESLLFLDLDIHKL